MSKRRKGFGNGSARGMRLGRWVEERGAKVGGTCRGNAATASHQAPKTLRSHQHTPAARPQGQNRAFLAVVVVAGEVGESGKTMVGERSGETEDAVEGQAEEEVVVERVGTVTG